MLSESSAQVVYCSVAAGYDDIFQSIWTKYGTGPDCLINVLKIPIRVPHPWCNICQWQRAAIQFLILKVHFAVYYSCRYAELCLLRKISPSVFDDYRRCVDLLLSGSHRRASEDDDRSFPAETIRRLLAALAKVDSRNESLKVFARLAFDICRKCPSVSLLADESLLSWCYTKKDIGVIHDLMQVLIFAMDEVLYRINCLRCFQVIIAMPCC